MRSLATSCVELIGHRVVVCQEMFDVETPEAAADAYIAAEDANYSVFVHVNNLSADVEQYEGMVANLRSIVEAKRAVVRKSEKTLQTYVHCVIL
jgi:hypothetical protein